MSIHSDLTALAIVVLAALACGMIMTRLRQPAVVGYILAGVILGPTVLGGLEDRENISFLAELGVLMLLFFIGMELNLRDFRAVWRIAVATALLQVAGGLLVMFGLGYFLGWPTGVAVLFGFVMALSSTAVVVKMLEAVNILRTPVGQLTLGVLIAQDLAVIPMVLMVSALGKGGIGVASVAEIAIAVAFLVGLIRYLSRGRKVVLPFARVVAGNLDLTPLAGLVYCFGAAAVAGLLGLSPAFGAFLAGLFIGNSTGRRAMIRSTRPIQAVLLMLFFLSIGLLFDLGFIWDNLGTVILLLLFVTVVKTALNMAVLHALREPWPHAFISGLMLAQIGEFSFVLGTAGVAAGVIGAEENSLIIAVAVLSLLFSPLWQLMVRRLLRIALASITSLSVTFRLLGGRKGIRALALLRRSSRLAGQAAGEMGRKAWQAGPLAKPANPGIEDGTAAEDDKAAKSDG
jgi:CPA2 family monovalent cation:H+ antiporter-2